jgi:hypothetical protein
VKPGPDLDRVLARALAAKLEVRRALALLPYEEKIRRLLQMQANAAAIREARDAQRVAEAPLARGPGR